jgi:hypothetical protein
MEVAESQRFYFSLSQADMKSSGNQYSDIDFNLFKVKKSQTRIWE